MARAVGIGIILGLSLAACGCRSESRSVSPIAAEPATADLRLRFSPGQTDTYRTVLEQGKSVSWHGPESTKPEGFEDGRTDNRTEMAFRQEVLSVDPAGDAVVRITITALKYFNRISNRIEVDFDNSRPADQGNPLVALVDQSYQIKLSRRGDVLEIVEAAQARAAVPASLPPYRIVERMLSDDGIKERHTIAALAALRADQARPGQSWSSEKSFSFSMMGSKSFERIYTLRDVSERDGARLATIEMNAIPATPRPQQGLAAMSPFAGTFDNASYEGHGVFDLENGRVRECVEQMRSEWVVMDSQAVQSGAVPRAVKMAASWSRRLELVK